MRPFFEMMMLTGLLESGYVHADQGAARELLEGAGAELAKASKAAATWARKRAKETGQPEQG